MGWSASKDKAKPPQKQSTYRQGGFIQGGVGVGGYSFIFIKLLILL